MDGLGLYLAVPFCRSKCSFCNFASGVFPRAQLEAYAGLLAREVELVCAAEGCGGARLETLYWGGGTPSLLPGESFERVMAAVGGAFTIAPGAEHTVEVAPGTLGGEVLEAFGRAGVNRLSFGVQSFQDEEVRAVGRLHRRATVEADVERARAAGLGNVSLDLIAGLPHQTAATWRDSVERAIASGAPHVSVYMLEVDEDSRLGTELLAGGVRYHAHAVPEEDQVADSYEWAVEALEAAGLRQYEISNFARPGFESRHNEGYWLRRPYLGAGLDAHSFYGGRRWANPDGLAEYMAALGAGRLPRTAPEAVGEAAAREEYFFLGLRRNEGVEAEHGDARIGPLVEAGLLEWRGERVRLTGRGRMVANRVLAEFLYD